MMILEYVEALDRQFRTGLSTEHSYRPLLQGLLAELLPGVEVTNEPQRIDCGAPDFILTCKSVPVGYIEAKDIGKPLDGRLLIHDITPRQFADIYAQTIA
jgi:hypothetical protein